MLRFEFNIYVHAQGHLNHKNRQNTVWHKPVVPPDMLRDAIHDVVQWVKSIEAARDAAGLQSRPGLSWQDRPPSKVGGIYLQYER